MLVEVRFRISSVFSNRMFGPVEGGRIRQHKIEASHKLLNSLILVSPEILFKSLQIHWVLDDVVIRRNIQGNVIYR